jgi:hypothetical protein
MSPVYHTICDLTTVFFPTMFSFGTYGPFYSNVTWCMTVVVGKRERNLENTKVRGQR